MTVSSISTFLMAKNGQERSKDQLVDEREMQTVEWINKVNSLLYGVKEWLSDSIDLGLITVEETKILIQDCYNLNYTATRMTITWGEKTVSITPSHTFSKNNYGRVEIVGSQGKSFWVDLLYKNKLDHLKRGQIYPIVDVMDMCNWYTTFGNKRKRFNRKMFENMFITLLN